MAQITTLMPYALPGQLYGSFSGKTVVAPSTTPAVRIFSVSAETRILDVSSETRVLVII